MGNEASSQQNNGRDNATFRDSTASLTTSPGTTTRRIVKAVKPTFSPDALVLPEGESKKENEDDEDSERKRGRRSVPRDLPLPIHESPSMAREQELEKMKEQKKERLETMQENQRARREKRLEDRRHRFVNPNEPTIPDGVATVKPNPFSKFLSVFSVEPKYPEHKRSYEVSENDEPEPDIKKPRALAQGEEPNDSGESNSFLRNGVIAATAAAIAAIVAGVLLKGNRSKV